MPRDGIISECLQRCRAGASLVFGRRFKNRRHRWHALIIEISSFADTSSSRAGVIGARLRLLSLA
jgi:hypothetical protein